MNLSAEINTIPQLIRHTVIEIHPETKTFLKIKARDNWTNITTSIVLLINSDQSNEQLNN